MYAVPRRADPPQLRLQPSTVEWEQLSSVSTCSAHTDPRLCRGGARSHARGCAAFFVYDLRDLLRELPCPGSPISTYDSSSTRAPDRQLQHGMQPFGVSDMPQMRARAHAMRAIDALVKGRGRCPVGALRRLSGRSSGATKCCESGQVAVKAHNRAQIGHAATIAACFATFTSRTERAWELGRERGHSRVRLRRPVPRHPIDNR